ncbi:MAG: alanine dehydrogenase [Gammaproteobacteria bacterium]|nr:alanine dehydrogenase [Gammaproteobacteria bacterium]
MLIGVPKEIKNHEYRVGLTPGSVKELSAYGHTVLVESRAGAGIRMNDEDYRNAGAEIVADPAQIYARAELIVKVKEPQHREFAMLRDGQVLFTYLHLAPDPVLARQLMKAGVIGIAYETVTGPNNTLPLLAPMSEVAGRLSIQAGAHCLEKANGGAGVLLGGVPGVEKANVLIIGGGVVGENAAAMALGMEADVTILDRSLPRLRQLDAEFQGKVRCIYSTRDTIEKYALDADLVVGAVLIPGGTTPKLLTRDIVRRMRPGSVVVDVAIDQGGCFETSHPTTHQEPTYVVDEVVHFCVANMPGAVPRTSTFALNNATLPFTLALANRGYRQAMLRDPDLRNGLNVYKGRITHQAVAEALGAEYQAPADALAA